MPTPKSQNRSKRARSAHDGSDDEDDGSAHGRRVKSTRSPGQSFAGSSQNEAILIGDDTDDDDADVGGNEVMFMTQNDENDFESYELYGSIRSKVVGIRYYNGVAGRNESVLLRREPHNQYDANAIRVDNVRGEQIGHIPRQIAAKLASFMDCGDLIVEGQLADNPGEYDVPLRIQAFGPSDPEEKTVVQQRMRQANLPTDELRRKDAAEKSQRQAELKKAANAAKSKKAEKAGSKTMQWANGINQGEGDDSSGPTAEDLVEESQIINPREMGQLAEKFGAQEDDLSQMPEAQQPERVSTKLLPYQKQALAWLLEKEDPQFPKDGKETVQLWQMKKASKGNITYSNIATNFTTKTEPTLARGGILADDMGLGKTLEIISLIIADKAKFGDQGPTLVVAPVSVMSNWSQQIERHVDAEAPLRVHIYHGSGRKSVKPAELKKFDVVITTYGTLSVEYIPKGKSAAKKTGSSGLFAVKWRRMILDEGHNVRNPNTKNALAACAVDSWAKWALTGTPIVNSLKDLYSLIRYIGLTGGLERFELFNSILIRPIKEGNEDAHLVLQALMNTFCLRRRKDMFFVNLKLPEMTEYVHRVKFSDQERKRYDALQDEARGTLRTFENENGRNAQHAYRHLLEVLLRLRQVCNHWKLCEERVSSLMDMLEKQKFVDLTPENRKKLQALLQLSLEQREDCPICLETLHDPVITHCGHVFGNDCITRVIETQRKCPMCRAELRDETKLVPPAIEYGEDASDPDTKEKEKEEEEEEEEEGGEEEGNKSTKLEALLKILRANKKKKGSKVVIFSQWCRFLDLVQPHLKEAGYQLTRIDGSMSATQRDKALRSFDSDEDTTVMLASLGVCAVGLNLVAADTVVLCDSWWAPAIEDQAVDRVHRLGQTRPTTVWRLIMEDSVEERTLEIQKDKRQLMALALKEGPDERKRREGGRSRTLGDIQRLLD